MKPLTRAEVEAWPELGPMNVDRGRVLVLFDAMEMLSKEAGPALAIDLAQQMVDQAFARHDAERLNQMAMAWAFDLGRKPFTCAYCFTMAEDIEAHIEACPSHPLAKAWAEVWRMREVLRNSRRIMHELLGVHPAAFYSTLKRLHDVLNEVK